MMREKTLKNKLFKIGVQGRLSKAEDGSLWVLGQYRKDQQNAYIHDRKLIISSGIKVEETFDINAEIMRYGIKIPQPSAKPPKNEGVE